MNKWGDRLKKVELLAQSFQLNPLSAQYKPRLWPCQPSSIWKLFPRQSIAISCAQSCKEAVHVFALEKEKTSLGQRIFLVTSYSELWHYYRTYTQSLMHCYEVIPEGAVCKLYFDLEFHKPSNTGADGQSMVSSLIQYVCDRLMEVYGIECSAKNVLNLDSSTAEKFSRHLIFNLQNAAFKDNIHMGRFIHAILQSVLSTPTSCLNVGMNSVAENSETSRTQTVSEGTPATPEEMVESPQAKRRKQEEKDLRFLQVKNKDGQHCLFVDLGVYTKNRNFRLYKSSKVGKNAAFTVADDNKFTDKPEKGISEEESVFLASLVCNISFTGQRILTSDIPETKESKTSGSPRQQESATDPGLLSGYLSSPYQEVDNFVLTVVTKDGVHGSIRRWNYFAAEQLVVYDIAKYRWCENVKRFHKSNNVMIVVDLKEEAWYQKCHDPECRNFRSSSYPLPQEICVSYIMTLDEEDQAYLMDDAGNIELSQASNPPPQSRVCPEEESADVWGDGQDDQDYLESLDDFEQISGDISDQLLLKCMAEFDSK
ncbi:DNA-directed primase/polymerase protein isoform X1 [Cottoperca gobio]|uniref:DNA-directed primase/polymerase protein n=1 Tax=Cottoperca gobio TaxID=56716 RepID=A0A6J2PMA9_COTGO|nr:DNA-directed primase/polymerase protein isoform X1 [Cottoperca gobio]XP_029287246.1 DNA-directed primase/polymerase protein isoform X1 [Cottoperca gobio]XP_029287258.1 DNA-directed primase/polymerase protein isoform X1 [Cottoperca gobio]XP_029287267.1 DNA-directed primase/polymerase protein isoform X1 [Cottoperca gobio]